MSKETIIAHMTGSIALDYKKGETDDEQKERLEEMTRFHLAGLFDGIARRVREGRTRIPFLDARKFSITLVYEEDKWDGRYILKITKEE